MRLSITKPKRNGTKFFPHFNYIKKYNPKKRIKELSGYMKYGLYNIFEKRNY